MKYLVLLLSGIVMGCTTYPQHRQQDSSANQAPQGWFYHCNTNRVQNTRTCSASKGGVRFFVGDSLVSYMVAPAKDKYPGARFSLRIDNDKPITCKEHCAIAVSKQIFDRLLSAQMLYVNYRTWPSGVHDAAIDVRNFDKVYAELKRMLN